MAFIRFAAALAVTLLMGCSPKAPSPELLSQTVLKQLVPSVATAESVAIIACSPESPELPSEFAIQVAAALSERISSGGLSTDAQPEVQVYATPDELQDAEAADITLYFQVTDHQLEGEFETDRVEIVKLFKADAWIYSSDNDTPFTMNSGFETRESATGPETDAASAPNWESFKYASDPHERLQQFARECAGSILKTFQDLSAKLGA